MRTFATLEELVEYRRSQEPADEREERLAKMRERMRITDARCHKVFQDSIPSQALLDKVISL